MPKNEKDNPLSEHVTQRVREGIFIITVAVSLFLFFALLTYNRLDPSWSYTGSGGAIHNAGGRVGAWLADVFFYSFGYLAYAFPLMIIYGAFILLRNAVTQIRGDHLLTILRVIGFALILLAGCGLASVEIPQFPTQLPFTTGGVVGQMMGNGLLRAFNMAGSSLLLLALLLTGVTLYTNLSWLQVIDNVGRVSLWLFECVVMLKDYIQEKRVEWQSARMEQMSLREKVPPSSLPRAIKSMDEKPQVPAQRKVEIKRPQVSNSTPTAAPKQKPALLNYPVTGSLPSLNLLDPIPEATNKGYSNAVLEEMSREVEQRLADFNVQAQVVAVHPGPVITRFELQLAPGLKVSKITGLAKDLARSLSVISVRVVEVIPGKSVIGLELPNESREVVRLADILAAAKFEQAKSPLSLALGKDIAGHPIVVDLAKMPHLLVAGTTGSGKSVGLNAMLLSILYKASPRDVRMILIDPKMLELSVYEGIPHLLAPVVTDMKEAASALRWCVAEMERRYKVMAALGVRNLTGFNHKVREAQRAGKPLQDPLWSAAPGTDEEPPLLEPLPYIMVLVDEFADMMMVVGKKVEELIARIAQKARAAGIHLILATQRPSVDVITGLIKANIPTRIAFQVSSRIDSRTILDQQGAEQLLGQGDMLYLPPGTGVPIRVHGAFVDDHEVHRVVNDWRHRGEPEFIDAILQCADPKESGAGISMDGDTEDADPLYDQAVRIVTETRRASISSIQRRLKIGFNRAARLLEQMEQDGVVSPMEGNGQREVLAPPPPE